MRMGAPARTRNPKALSVLLSAALSNTSRERTHAGMSESVAGESLSSGGRRLQFWQRAVNMCLIFDADDTLWENNIYFLRAIEEFLDLIAHLAQDRSGVLQVLS